MLEVSSWVGVVGLSNELAPVELVSEEGTREVECLTSHNHNLLASQKLLGNLGGESTHQVTSSVYDNLLFEHI